MPKKTVKKVVQTTQELRQALREEKKNLKLLQKEYKAELTLVAEVAYEQGYSDAIEDVSDFEDAREKYLDRENLAFEKEYLAKVSGKNKPASKKRKKA